MTKTYPRLYRRITYGLFLISWLSGTAFYILNRWVTVEGDFGPEKHPWQFPILMAHGASAFFMIFMFGVAVASHIAENWHVKAVRRLSISLAVLISFQIISAYLLYYLANQDWREWIALVHTIVGVLLPSILIGHVLQAWRVRRAEAKESRQ